MEILYLVFNLIRMKFSSITFIFLLSSLFLFSQNKAVDSLQSLLQKAKSDHDKTILLNAIAEQYKAIDPNKMADYAKQALQLSQKIEDNVQAANAFVNLGTSKIILGDYNAALIFFDQASVIFENELVTSTNTAIKSGLARTYGSIGIVFSEQNNYAKALQNHLKALQLYEDLQDKEKMARIYNNIGVVFRAQNQDFKALDYFSKAQKIQEQIQDKTVGITTTNIGNLYLKQKNYEKAFAIYQEAEQLFKKHPNYRGLGELYNNLGLYYKATNQNELAVTTWNLALSNFDKIGDQFGKADTNLYLSQFYEEQAEYQKALPFAQKAAALTKEIGNLEGLTLAEKQLSTIFEKLGDEKAAFFHFKQFKIAQDSLMNYERIRKSLQVELNYEYDKKEAIQKKEIEKRELLANEKSKRQHLITFFVVLVLLFVFGIVFLLYSRMQLKKTLTLQKELAEYEQKALHLQMNPHFVFNCLGSISSFIVQNGTDSALKYLAKFSKLMRLTLEYSKEPLIPIDKEIESLQNYLELEQLRFNQKFDFIITKSKDIEDDMALPPLLLQPFVENSIIHGLIPKAEKGKISIHFSIEKNSLSCTIEDTGIGVENSKEFKQNLVSVHKSMALDITKKRLEMMEASTSQKAKVEIKEVKNEKGETQGTKVFLNLPIQYSK
ncbi:tetratricopeptide repeat protein [Flavobacterium sp.]|uniref:tetratricopeptide repeat-containing sensor histidine kinase n=1 Tax=Flavobacterium sp. TaxID=239 RepID=UPI00260BB208|nr:tetratricopeptide repeat protein [Flavobacterium sp.]MDD2985934.1 tetratricopeptide repeat protein [Flavobacterium sp.]